jgi:hypothetical protein
MFEINVLLKITQLPPRKSSEMDDGSISERFVLIESEKFHDLH